VSHMNKMLVLTAGLAISATYPLVAFTFASADTPTAPIYACADESDDAARLACFDAAVAALKASEEAGEVATVAVAEIEEAERDAFGLEGEQAVAAVSARIVPRRAEPPAELDEVTAGVVSITENNRGELIVTLDNGQVWRQSDSASVSISRKKPPETATVRKAALGSFRMKLGRASPFRVKRVE